MNIVVNTQSPIPWPRSDKRRTPKILTPRLTDRDTGNKLSTKKSGSTECESVTPRRSLSKWPLPSRSSIETFHRVYNEMTNSLTDKMTNTSDKRPTSDLQSNSCASSTPQRKSTPCNMLVKQSFRNARTLTNNSSFSSSSATSSSKSMSPVLIDSSSSSDEVTPSTNRARIVIDSSSDDSFELPPPLHQRVPLTPSCASIQKNTITVRTVNDSTRRKDISSSRMKPKKSIVFNDSSSEEENKPPTPPIRTNFMSVSKGARQISKPVVKFATSAPRLNPGGKGRVPTQRTPKKSIVFDNSSPSEDDSLVLARKTPVKEHQLTPYLSELKPSGQKNFILTPVSLGSKQPTSPVPKDHAKTGNGFCNTWLSPESLTNSSGFLKSLSDAASSDPQTAHFRKQFSKHKDELVKRLYQLYNNTVFENKLPSEMSITWNIRLTKTAGYCYMRSHRDLSRTARIELSTKVLDSAERVRDTLLHEMCHAAAFLVYGYRDGHGPLFKHWGRKAGILFPFLPVVSRCHTYSINTKFVYRCLNCQASVGRHTKSVDVSRKGCGHCGGRFELLVNGVVSDSTKKKKTPEFAQFVKDNYKHVKVGDQNLKHSEIMQKLGQMFNDKAALS